MIGRRPALALAALALMQPPVAVEAHVLALPACGGGTHRMLLLPGDPLDPGQRRDCAKACHAVTDRRGKAAGKKCCC